MSFFPDHPHCRCGTVPRQKPDPEPGLGGPALAIHRGLGAFALVIAEPYGTGPTGTVCYLHAVVLAVPFGELRTRPDPIRRAWAAVEAKQGMVTHDK